VHSIDKVIEMISSLAKKIRLLVREHKNRGIKGAMRRKFIFDIKNTIKIRQLNHPNLFCRYGAKTFSQSDEDGLTLEIIRRLEIKDGTYCEYGVGNGAENNTLILAALGWRGFWVGGEDLAFSWKQARKFFFIKEWVTADNIEALHKQGQEHLKVDKFDIASLDFDGNDLHFVRKLLAAGLLPRLFIVEYNSKFIPPVRFTIEYDAKHNWQGDDYYGASLQSFADLFDEFGYQCIVCNAATGNNAFFVKKEDAIKFPEVPKELSLIYSEPHMYVLPHLGHKPSMRVIENIINQ
jgi:hypothetical protein